MFEKLVAVGVVDGIGPRVLLFVVVLNAVVTRVLTIRKRHPGQSKIRKVVIEYEESLTLATFAPNKPVLGVIDHHRCRERKRHHLAHLHEAMTFRAVAPIRFDLAAWAVGQDEIWGALG